MEICKYSFGVGDRFGRQGEAQLNALAEAREKGCPIAPVWNKSYREHTIVGTSPDDVRLEADNAVAACGWDGLYYVDADHIGRENVDGFLSASDFFTLDVADCIGEPAAEADLNGFVEDCRHLCGTINLPGLDGGIGLTGERIRHVGGKYLAAAHHAAELYRYVGEKKGEGAFITEVSMDETDAPQEPDELLLILKALSHLHVPVQTIAPKFSGEFYKGVDYVGDPEAFRAEFRSDLAVIRFAVKEFGLPANLKLSIHSGSDKFSLYPVMKNELERCGAGLHLKTAGTTWLEELIGLALSGGDALAIAAEIYCRALERMEELCGPYAAVIDIDPAKIPGAGEVRSWSGRTFADALRHDPSSDAYNPHLRQLLHVAYKVAAEMGDRYLDALEDNREVIAENVTMNLYERHILELFPGIT